MKLYTIGFAKKTAQQFFELLAHNGVTRLVDIRLHPHGQLAGFTKQEDLRYFLDRLIGCDYIHMLNLAPEEDILRAYRSSHDWNQYAQTFIALLDRRNIPAALDRTVFEEKVCCLLCSEPTPEYCHRRLVAERLASEWKNVEIIHI